MQWITWAVCAAALSAPGETVLLEFSASWCEPCQRMAPVIEQLQSAGVAIQQIDIEKQRAVAERFRITEVPTFLLIVDGREVRRTVGEQSFEHLSAMWSSATATPTARSGPAASPARAAAGALPPTEADTLSDSRMFAQTRGAVAEAPTEEAYEPRLLASTVRLRIADATGQSCGTGTLVDQIGDEALILTCGHIFRESKGDGKITVDLFGPGAKQGVEGQLVAFDLKRDLGLVAIRTSGQLLVTRVAPPGYQVQPGSKVVSVGCDHGADPTAIASRVASLNKYVGPPNVQVAGQPVEGRSGGGLFSEDGMLIGVCNAADPEDNEGLYAAHQSIHSLLDESNLAQVYRGTGASSSGPTALAHHNAEEALPEMPERMPGPTSIGVPTATNPAADAPAFAAAAAEAFADPATALNDHAAALGDRAAAVVEGAENALSHGAESAISHGAESALAAIRQQAGDAEVICVIRSSASPNGKSEVIVLDRASPALLQQLAAERNAQGLRQLTATRLDRAGRSARPYASPAARMAGQPNRAAATAMTR